MSRCAATVPEFFLPGQRGERLFHSARNERIDADDRVFRGELLVGHLDRAVFVEHGLESVDRLGPRKVLNVALRFGDVPRHDHAIASSLT